MVSGAAVAVIVLLGCTGPVVAQTDWGWCPTDKESVKEEKRRTTKYEDEANTDDEEGIEEEGLELPVKDVKGVEKGEEKMGGGKRGMKAKRFEDEDEEG